MFFKARFYAARFFKGRFFGGEQQAIVAAETGSAAPWWWLQRQPVPYGTQPAHARGDELWLFTELEPGTARGAAKTKGRRLRRDILADKGVALGWAIAGNASAVFIPAWIEGQEIGTAAHLRTGVVSAGARVDAVDLNSVTALTVGRPAGHALTPSRNIRGETLFRAGASSGYARVPGRNIRGETSFVIGNSSGGARVIANMPRAVMRIESGAAHGTFRLDPVLMDNDLLMLAA